MNKKISDYLQFIKLRLSLLVVFSAASGFVMAPSHNVFQWLPFLLLLTGGFLVTASANGFNQIIERDVDKLMSRTANRPLPAQRMNVAEAILVATLTGSTGFIVLAKYNGILSTLLALFAFVIYLLVYTPLKRRTPFAVFAGAVSGAVPPLLGWTAITRDITFDAFLLFFVQFTWQFPHFWAIAWILDEDYRKAGFKLLPSTKGKSKMAALQTFFYTLALIPVSLLLKHFQIAGTNAFIVICFCSILFTIQATQLYFTCSDKSALRLMFGSFLYLPGVLLTLMIDKFRW